MKRVIFVAVCVLALAPVLSSQLAYAAEPVEIAELQASDGVLGTSSISLDGNRAFVGDETDNFGSGAVYIFESIGDVWTEISKLLASDGAQGDRFGVSVVLDGDRALIGTRVGLVYVFENVGGIWTQTAKLLEPDGTITSFGRSVALDGNRALIGDSLDTENGGTRAGAAYVFENIDDTWTQTAKLLADDGHEYEYFGFSVSLSGDRALIGVAGVGEGPFGSPVFGAAYIFDNMGGTWTQTAKLLASDSVLCDKFGISVSLDGDTALIGTAFFRFEDCREIPIPDEKAYIFSRTNGEWTETATLNGSVVGFENFGGPVSLSGNRALIGAPTSDVSGTPAIGAAYTFENVDGVWTKTAILRASDGASNDRFGRTVSLDGSKALVGTSNHQHDDTRKGAAYVFSLGSDPLIISIDIKPGSEPNCFNINGHGVVPVAILGSDIFDVTNIDQSTLNFGGLDLRLRGNSDPMCSLDDTNGDGIWDLVCHFEDDPGAWTAGDSEATVTGELFDGTLFEGTDSICIVPRGRGRSR